MSKGQQTSLNSGSVDSGILSTTVFSVVGHLPSKRLVTLFVFILIQWNGLTTVKDGFGNLMWISCHYLVGDLIHKYQLYDDFHYYWDGVYLFDAYVFTFLFSRVAPFLRLSCQKGPTCHAGILPKGPYLPCLSMAVRALLAGYPRYVQNVMIWFCGISFWN